MRFFSDLFLNNATFRYGSLYSDWNAILPPNSLFLFIKRTLPKAGLTVFYLTKFYEPINLSCMRKLILITLLSLSVIVPSMGQSAQQKMKTAIQTEINYLMFLPKDYAKTGKPSPMIVFLHGSGERGTDLEKVKAWGPPAIAEKNADFPFIVISPQCPEGQWWNTYLLKGMIDDVLAKYNVDKSRVYLTGLSMGGLARGNWR